MAKTDTCSLYNSGMSIYCGIAQSGSSGSYAYSVASNDVNLPLVCVSFWDSCRFANWLGNGQPNGSEGVGTTETGAYTLNGYDGDDGGTI